MALAILTMAAFARAAQCGFVTYDDNTNLYLNPKVSGGLGWGAIIWAFTSTAFANWYPLTWLTHELDFSLYGQQAGGHHVTNVLLHTATVVVLFLALRKLTGTVWRSALVAALFAVHPLRVESVAWVSERKDVLSGLFWMLTMLAYANYAKAAGQEPKPDRGKLRNLYLWVVLFFVLGLMSKPSVVTLPAALLLLDYWPLGRWKQGWGVVWEKLPLFALSAASSVLTMVAQRSGGATQYLADNSVQGLPTLPVRLSNIAVSYVAYLRQTFWPAGFSILYPFQFDLPQSQVITAAAILAGITVAALLMARRLPAVTVGWLWYLGVMLPMSGVVQVGLQSRADRYTYLPHIGLFVALVWGVAAILRRRVVPVVGTVALALAVVSWTQTGYWKDSVSLYERSVAATPNSKMLINNLGLEYFNAGNLDPAVRWFRKAVQVDPSNAISHSNLAVALASRGDSTEALTEAETALRLRPNYEPSFRAKALALEKMRRFPEAMEALNEAIRSSDSDGARAEAYDSRGGIYIKMAKATQAEVDFRAALRLDPSLSVARRDLANSLAFQQRYAEALAEYERYLLVEPSDPIALKAARELRGALGR